MSSSICGSAITRRKAKDGRGGRGGRDGFADSSRRSASETPGCSSGRSRAYQYQSATSRRDGTLVTMSAQRQPYACMSQATRAGVAAAPDHRPVTTSDCADAHEFRGNQVRIVPAPTGKRAACATPRSERATRRATKTPAPATVPTVAITVASPIAASMRRAPIHCPTRAPGIWNTA